MQHFLNDATLFFCYYPEKSYHFVQHKSHMDCLGNQPSLCGAKLTTPVTAEDINRTDKTTLVCVDRDRRKSMTEIYSHTVTCCHDCGQLKNKMSLAASLTMGTTEWCRIFEPPHKNNLGMKPANFQHRLQALLS
jgi:hypothetical protein